MTKSVFACVKEVVDDWDPEGLFSCGAPSDEYDSESGKIAGQISRESSVEEIAAVVAAVINKSFGYDEEWAFLPKHCMGRAEKIKAKLDELEEK